MKKYTAFIIIFMLLIFNISAHAEQNCQQTPIIQEVEESGLQHWQSWEQKNAIKANLKNDGLGQSILVMANKANEWAIIIKEAEQHTLVYAGKSVAPLQVMTKTIDNLVTLQISNTDTKQTFDVSYKGPQNFSICPIQPQKSHYKCTGIGQAKTAKNKTYVATDYVDFNLDGKEEAFDKEFLGKDGNIVVLSITDSNGFRTVVYKGMISIEDTTFVEPFAINNGKPVVHLIIFRKGQILEALEINYIDSGKFTTCPLLNGKELIIAHDVLKFNP